MKIRYRPTALEQLERIHDYIAADSERAAQRIIARIKRTIDLLTQLPNSGRPSEIAGIRELPIVRYPYIVFYTLDAEAGEVVILRVRHTSQDPAHHLD